MQHQASKLRVYTPQEMNNHVIATCSFFTALCILLQLCTVPYGGQKQALKRGLHGVQYHRRKHCEPCMRIRWWQAWLEA